MKKGLLILCLTASLFASAQTKTAPNLTKPKLAVTYTAAQAIKNTKDSASYALGYRIAQSM